MCLKTECRWVLTPPHWISPDEHHWLAGHQVRYNIVTCIHLQTYSGSCRRWPLLIVDKLAEFHAAQRLSLQHVSICLSLNLHLSLSPYPFSLSLSLSVPTMNVEEAYLFLLDGETTDQWLVCNQMRYSRYYVLISTCMQTVFALIAKKLLLKKHSYWFMHEMSIVDCKMA